MKPVTIPFFISHQGCPHTCAFCNQHIISGSDGQLPTPEQITDKILVWQASASGRPLEVAFFGGSFTALSKQQQWSLLEPLQHYLANGIVTSVRISTRPDYIDTEHLSQLFQAGVRTVELGIQSLDDAVLSSSQRGHSAAQGMTAIQLVKQSGMKTGAQLMPGLPGDNLSKSFASLQKVINAGADFIRLYPVVVMRDTALADSFLAGAYQPPNLEQGVAICKVLLQFAMQQTIPVIRIGLQATTDLNEEHIVAGCWHPAFGQLVRSGLYEDLITQVVHDDSTVTISCHPSRYSDVVGIKRSNLVKLAKRGIMAKIVSNQLLSVDQLKIVHAEEARICSVLSDLSYSNNEVCHA